MKKIDLPIREMSGLILMKGPKASESRKIINIQLDKGL